MNKSEAFQTRVVTNGLVAWIEFEARADGWREENQFENKARAENLDEYKSRLLLSVNKANS